MIPGDYMIDTDGEGGLEPFKVTCPMRKGSEGLTEVHHSDETTREYSGPGPATRSEELAYNTASYEQVCLVVEISASKCLETSNNIIVFIK